MEHLLYSSNEMFSSTHLVRKSKEIFDKLVSNEISKAVILRDGKPNFMLLDFNKYEKIMKEFLEYKNYYEENINKKVQKKDIIEQKDEIKESNNEKEKEEKELLKVLAQLETLNLDDDLKEETQNKLKETSPAQIKDFWNK